MLQKIYQFKAKDSEIKPYPLYLGNTSKGFTIVNIKKTGLKGVVKGFTDILDIHIYLRKDTCKIIFGFTKKCFLGY